MPDSEDFNPAADGVGVKYRHLHNSDRVDWVFFDFGLYVRVWGSHKKKWGGQIKKKKENKTAEHTVYKSNLIRVQKWNRLC